MMRATLGAVHISLKGIGILIVGQEIITPQEILEGCVITEMTLEITRDRALRTIRVKTLEIITDRIFGTIRVRTLQIIGARTFIQDLQIDTLPEINSQHLQIGKIMGDVRT